MWKSKDVYYISDGTGILATTLGQSLLCQFPEINFHEEHFPFIRTEDEAKKTMKYIVQKSGGRRPLIFSTVMDPSLIKILDSPEVEFFDAYEFFLSNLETCLEAKALRVPGYSRHVRNVSMVKRVEAINFCLEHDDGTKLEELAEADAILIGVSRSGKTPVSVFLATQMGLRAGNFPLTEEYLQRYTLPDEIKKNIRHAVGLTTTPEVLHSFREKRYPGSNYAKLSTCYEEIDQAEEIFFRSRIPVVNTAGKSIEEIATQVLQELGISKKPQD